MQIKTNDQKNFAKQPDHSRDPSPEQAALFSQRMNSQPVTNTTFDASKAYQVAANTYGTEKQNDAAPENAIQFDEASLEAIERISKIKELTNVLGSVLSGGVLLNIFARSGVLGIHHNVSNTDWQLFGEALAGLDKFSRQEIAKIAEQQYLLHPHDFQQSSFWRNVMEAANQ